MFCA
ncbi:hypothetical protein D041_0489A, partial [Vibrio parahaemolyticus EKP-008]